MTNDDSHWPITVGTIGIVLGILLILDKVDDLLTLQWTAAEWGSIFGSYVADWISRALPPPAWRLVSAIVQVGLGALLITASVALRRRSRAGVSRCRLWAWLAIGWVVALVGYGVLWMVRHYTQLPVPAAANWPGVVAFAFALALVLLLAFPVFLLVWLSRPRVRAEYEAWEM